jgi:hypothetical protein
MEEMMVCDTLAFSHAFDSLCSGNYSFPLHYSFFTISHVLLELVSSFALAVMCVLTLSFVMLLVIMVYSDGGGEREGR